MDSFTTVNFQIAFTGITNTKIALSVDNALDERFGNTYDRGTKQ